MGNSVDGPSLSSTLEIGELRLHNLVLLDSGATVPLNVSPKIVGAFNAYFVGKA